MEMPRPARPLTFSPTTSPGRATLFQASKGESVAKRACIERSSMFKRRAESELEPEPRRRGSRAITTLVFSWAEKKGERPRVPGASKALAAQVLRKSRRFDCSLRLMEGLGGSGERTGHFRFILTTLRCWWQKQRRESVPNPAETQRNLPPGPAEKQQENVDSECRRQGSWAYNGFVSRLKVEIPAEYFRGK